MKYFYFLFFILFLIFSVGVIAQTDLPTGVLKIKDYNLELSQNILLNVSLFIAFLAGVTSILSPCILAFLPAYFAITFKERKKITLTTSLFFLGFTTVFIIMGLLATLTGKTLVTIFKGINWIVPLAGTILVFFGIMMFLGRGFGGFSSGKKIGHDWKGLLASGALFAVGWTACIGPILSGLLLMTATFQNYGTASLLMLFYALGIFVPLFIFSFFYDELHLEKLSFLNKKISLRFWKKSFKTTYPNIIAGILFVFLGGVFIIFKGTWVINGISFFGLRKYFYAWQNLFMEKAVFFSRIGAVLFSIFILTLVYFLWKELKKNKGENNS